MVARQTLDLLVLVRVQARQPHLVVVPASSFEALYIHLLDLILPKLDEVRRKCHCDVKKIPT